MIKKIYYFLFFLLLVGSTLHAQQIKVSGKVIDNETQSGLTGANVLLKGNLEYTAITEESGEFSFRGIKPGEYILQISYIGYKPYKSDLKNIQKSFSFGTILLKTSISSLEEVVVEAKMPLAITKGDTIEYNADAYKTNPDADAEDLIKKMPGIVVDKGTIQAQGEDVKKVYVDGKPFFEQDPTLALKSLPADVIQKIEVFDEKSEQAQFTAFDDGETTKAMNIITRTKMKNGQFGKFFVGGGYPDKYQIGGNVNYFKDDQRLSLIGQSNNINQQNFSNEDLLGVTSNSGSRSSGFRGRSGGHGGGSGGSGMRGGGGVSSRDFMVGEQSGISNTTALGLNYSDKWSEKINVAGSYFFNTAKNKSNQEINQQYFTRTDVLSQSYTESNTSNSTNFNHRFNFKFDYDINENNKLIIRPRLSVQSNESENNILGNSIVNDTLLNKNLSSYNSDMLGYNFSNMILFMHKFQKKGRTVSFNLNTSLGSQDANNFQKSEIVNMEDILASDSLNLFNDNLNDNNSISGRIVYTEPIGEDSQLMLNTNSSVSYENSDRKAYNFDYLNNNYNIFDTSLSNVFNSSFYTQQFGAGYKYRKDKTYLMFGLDFEYAALKSEQTFPKENKINQTFTSLLPMVRYRYSISKSKNLNIFYRSNSKAPTVKELQNIIDYSNPLRLETGNPLLKPSYEHSLSVRYNTTNTSKATLFFIMGSIRYENNYIGNSTWFAYTDTLLLNNIPLQQGEQLTQPVNLDSYWNARLFSTYGLPIKKLKSNFNINASYNFSYTPGILNNTLSYSKNNVFGIGMVLSSNISKNIDFTLSSNTSYNNANSTLQSEINNSYLIQKTEINLNLIIWKGITFRTSAGNQYYYWTTEKNNESFMILNMEAGKKIFKNQLGEIKISVFDVLNQNSSINRKVTDVYVEDSSSNVLQRFFMLSFNYRLRNFGTKSTFAKASVDKG